MGDIIYHATVGPIPKKLITNLEALDGFFELLESIGAEVEEDSEGDDGCFLQAEDIAQMEDEIVGFLEAVLPEGHKFFMEEGTFMIGSMGLEEEDCGIFRGHYEIRNGKAKFTHKTWEPQDFS